MKEEIIANILFGILLAPVGILITSFSIKETIINIIELKDFIKERKIK